MTTLRAALTLDDYRAQVLKQLTNCTDPNRVCDILAEVELALGAMQMSLEVQKTFWQSLANDLDVLSQQVSHAPPVDMVLRAVIDVARAAIAHHQRAIHTCG
jgi:hypothetical protein